MVKPPKYIYLSIYKGIPVVGLFDLVLVVMHCLALTLFILTLTLLSKKFFFITN